MHPFNVYLTVAALLLCPYDCAVKSALARSVGDKTEHVCCEQCQSESATEEKETPEPTDPANDGRSCLCEGAVFDASVRTVQETLLFSFLWAPVVFSTTQVELSNPVRIACDASQPPPLLSGWERRVLILSLVL